MSLPRLTASMLFSSVQGIPSNGHLWCRCHWCGGPCNNQIVHDDPPPIPFVRSSSGAKCPSETYICMGCHLWRNGKRTINFLGGGFKDGQRPKDHSWLITDKVALVLEDGKGQDDLWRFLLTPSKQFVLALRSSKGGVDTLLHFAIANDPGGILADTPLYFTLNNVPHQYSIYELVESIRSPDGPSDPGTKALWNFLGGPPEDIQSQYPKHGEEKRGRGRPPAKEDARQTTKKVIVGSGEER